MHLSTLSIAQPQVGQKFDAEEAMRLAVQVANGGIGYVAPNPLVGCVILDQNNGFLASGFHPKVGERHAEIDAIQKISDASKLRGAKVYVTLEPCSHFGRTPPCAQKLVEVGVGEVFYGVTDPNPQVAGKGEATLKAAGIKTVCAQNSDLFSANLKEDLLTVAEVFLTNQKFQRTFVVLKIATSLDGKMALSTGESQWISNEHSREFSHQLRANYGAVMVGAHTLARDNPRLDIRHPQFPNLKNKVFVLDPQGQRLQTFKTWQLAQAHATQNIFWIVKEGAHHPMAHGMPNIIELPKAHGAHLPDMLDLQVLREELFRREIYSVMIEGGALTISEFLRQNAVDRLYNFIAPKILGRGLAWSETVEFAKMANTHTLTRVRTQLFGDDTLITGRLP